MNVRLVAALAGVAFFLSATAASAETTMAPTAGPVAGPTAAPVAFPVQAGSLALDARALRGSRTANGYRLTGQGLVKDACTAARFTRLLGNIFPPFFNVVQYRRPGTQGLFCIQRLTWVTIQPLSAGSAAPPRYVTVHTQKGSTRLPILR